MSDKYELPPYVLSRVRYYDGQFLTDDDFIDEQKYHLDHLRRLGRLTQTAGISEGLEVSLAQDGGALKLKVTAGTAVDGMGRQILLSADRLIAIDPGWSGILWMTIRFRELEDRHRDDDPTTGGVGGNTRFTVDPVIEVVPNLAALADKYPVALSQVQFAANVQPVITPTRTYSGLRLPGAAGATYALRVKQAGGAELSTGLSVTGDLRASATLGYDGLLSKLDVADVFTASVRAADFRIGHSSRRGSTGRALVDGVDTLVVNCDSDWKKTYIQGKDQITLETSVVSIPSGELRVGGSLTISGDRLKSAQGLGILQTNANDWLRINPDQQYPAIALHKSAAFGTGGVSIGDWTQMPLGQLRVTGDVFIQDNIRVLNGGRITLNVFDMLMGHPDRRGTPGRALVDATDTLVVNYDSDWNNTSIQGKNQISLNTSLVNIPGGKLNVGGDVSYTGTLSKLDVAEQSAATVRVADFLIGISGRRGSPGRALVDASETLVVNYGSDWKKTWIQGKDLITLDASLVTTGGDLRVTGSLTVNGDRLKSAQGLGIIQTNATDWLRINPDLKYPAIALYKAVAIGEGGGLSIGDWTQMPQGQLRVTGNAFMYGNLTMGKSIILLGRTDGSTTQSQEILGALGFLGMGVQHAQLSFRAGRGFEFVDVSGSAPNLTYPNPPPYADVYARMIFAANLFSDAELKRDVQVVEGAMEKLRQLRGVTFHWKDEVRGTERQLGVIAQEVEALFPELVSRPSGMSRYVHYEKFVPVLIQALKEQDERIAQLEARLAGATRAASSSPA